MRRSRLVLGGSTVLTLVALVPLMHARQAQIPANPAVRAQDNPPPAGSPFSTLAGFRVDRINPVEKPDSYIVITFDSRGRPVVGQSARRSH